MMTSDLGENEKHFWRCITYVVPKLKPLSQRRESKFDGEHNT